MMQSGTETVQQYRTGLVVLVSLLLHACSAKIPFVTLPDPNQDRGPGPGAVDVSSIPNAVPRDEPRSKYGNPPSYVVNGKTYYVMNSSRGFSEQGIASWYGEKFQGRRTSSGETYDMYAMTAAHKSLPLPTYVEVTNLQNGRKIIVKVNDRGPFHDNRVIDLSWTAASKLEILGKGTGLVEVRAIDRSYVAGNPTPNAAPVVVNAPVVAVTIPDIRNMNSGFFIQVGAFSQLANAQKMYDKLAGIGNNLVTISEVLVNGSRIFRVRIGPINDVSVADRIVSELAVVGILDHQLTTD
jgi:rare lipoprotein A